MSMRTVVIAVVVLAAIGFAVMKSGLGDKLGAGLASASSGGGGACIRMHPVQPGQTASGIARANRISWTRFAAANSGANLGPGLRAGDKLCILTADY